MFVGELILKSRHRVICGDSTIKEDVDKLMNGEKADMVFTDPPYGINYQSNGRVKTPKFEILQNDNHLLKISPIIKSYSTGFIFVWSSWKVMFQWVNNLELLGYPTNMIIWDKGGGGIGDLKKTFSTDWELCFVYHRGREIVGKRIGSVWNINKDAAVNYKHPTQKPVALAEKAITCCSNKDEKVLDIFLGSGSTLIDCEKTGRRCFGMEISEYYCDVIIKRFQEYSDKKVVLEATGQEFESVGQRA